MKIRDGHATINNDKTVYEMKSGSLEVIADDGHTLFHISLRGDRLDVSAGHFCKHDGKILDDRLRIEPRASNQIYCFRPEYEQEPKKKSK